jgi:pimeloyl-ACP methyl ester carboxylesterase
MSLPSARARQGSERPGIGVIADAAMWAGALSGVLNDHDLLLNDARGARPWNPRGTGRSHPLACGVTAVPATRDGLTRVIGDCGRRLGRQARAYTSAATADDFEAVRKHLGIPKLDL